MSKARLLIVHPDPSALSLLTSMLQSLGHAIDEAANDRVAVRLMERGGVNLVLAGVNPTDPEALELLAYIRRKHRHVPVILFFPSPHPERARDALRLGAMAVIKYPAPATELRAAVTQALGECKCDPASASENGAAAVAPATSSAPKVPRTPRELGVVGEDPSLRQTLELASTIAPTRTPVLIVGDHGTGKTLLARTIHALSPHSAQRFVSLDCSTLTEPTLERELFGARPGVLPDAPHDRNGGSSIVPPGGTLLLNEVADLSDALQWQLLHVLQDREAEHVGPNQATPLDVRLLMSTSENLLAVVEQGKFRQDLYYRISVICLKLPPLRHRGTDIERLAEFFRARFSLEFGKNIVGFTRDALEALNKHDWPGNVHELEGVIQRGVVLCPGTRITSSHLLPNLAHSRAMQGPAMAPRFHHPMSIRPLKEALEEPEKRIIIEALQALNWNRQETARVLDINRTTLYKKMKKYGLLVDDPIWVN